MTKSWLKRYNISPNYNQLCIAWANHAHMYNLKFISLSSILTIDSIWLPFNFFNVRWDIGTHVKRFIGHLQQVGEFISLYYNASSCIAFELLPYSDSLALSLYTFIAMITMYFLNCNTHYYWYTHFLLEPWCMLSITTFIRKNHMIKSC